MSLSIKFTPYTTSNCKTKISVRTAHQLPGEPGRLLETQAEFMPIPSTENTKRMIQQLLDLVIIHPESIYFLRPVDPVIDRADNYLSIVERPIDLGLMRKKALTGSYTCFDEFSADMDLLIKNAVKYNAVQHCVHQAALRLSFYFREKLLTILENPEGRPFESANSSAAETRIAQAISAFQKLKKEAAKLEKQQDLARAKVPERQKRKMTEAETIELVQDIKRLKTSALMGVVEIIAKKPFSIELLPLEVDLSIADDSMLHKLKDYVDCVKDRHSHYYYAWKPILPDNLQELRDKYEAELLDWMKAPAEIVEHYM